MKKIHKNKCVNYIFPIVIILLTIIGHIIHNGYVRDIKESSKMISIEARIIKVGKNLKGGLGAAPTVGYISFEYQYNGVKYTKGIDSFYIRDHINNYKVGECIKISISEKHPDYVEFDETTTSFSCEHYILVTQGIDK